MLSLRYQSDGATAGAAHKHGEIHVYQARTLQGDPQNQDRVSLTSGGGDPQHQDRVSLRSRGSSKSG